MKIEQINIKNFRGIEYETFSFNPQFTTLIGDNGAGKTSILDAIAFAIGTIFLGMDGVSTHALKVTDKRRKMVSPNSIEIQLPLRIELKHSFAEHNFFWGRDTDKANGGSTSQKEANNLIAQAKEMTQMVRNGESVNLPLIAYYGVGRLSDNLYERNKGEKTGSRLDGYKGALDPRTMQHKALEWMKKTQEAILQQYQEEEKKTDEALFDAFVQVLSEMIPGWTKIQYNLKHDDVVGYFEDLGWQNLSTLSSGYKAIAKLAMDIAYRAIILNPHLKENAIKESKGIVLIDELDMHLHPKWQRTVVENLKNAFPNIQFITTTHSPFIVQSLKANEIINLNKIPFTEEPNTVGIEENALFMGVESINSDDFDTKEEIAFDYLKLLEGKPDKNLFAQLDELINTTTDPVFKAKLNLERLNKFGK
jgi:predicted ATP-binding protein involved in virulence